MRYDVVEVPRQVTPAASLRSRHSSVKNMHNNTILANGAYELNTVRETG